MYANYASVRYPPNIDDMLDIENEEPNLPRHITQRETCDEEVRREHNEYIRSSMAPEWVGPSGQPTLSYNGHNLIDLKKRMVALLDKIDEEDDHAGIYQREISDIADLLIKHENLVKNEATARRHIPHLMGRYEYDKRTGRLSIPTNPSDIESYHACGTEIRELVTQQRQIFIENGVTSMGSGVTVEPRDPQEVLAQAELRAQRLRDTFEYLPCDELSGQIFENFINANILDGTRDYFGRYLGLYDDFGFGTQPDAGTVTVDPYNPTYTPPPPPHNRPTNAVSPVLNDVPLVLAPEEIEKLKNCHITREEIQDLAPRIKCVVCQEAFVEGDDAIITPCGHIFHKTCIVTWVSEHSHCCPLCRKSYGRHIPKI